MSKNTKKRYFLPGLACLLFLSLGVFAMRSQENKVDIVTSVIRDFQLSPTFSDYMHFGQLLYPTKFEQGSCIRDFDGAYCISKKQGDWAIQIAMRSPKYFLNLEETIGSYREQGATVFVIEIRGTKWLLIYNQSSIDSLGHHSWLAVSAKEDAEYVIDFKFFKDVDADEQAELLGFLKAAFWLS